MYGWELPQQQGKKKKQKKHVQAEHQMDRPRHIDDQSSAPNPCVWLQSWRIALHPFLGHLGETRQE